jgi:hypothetical protein
VSRLAVWLSGLVPFAQAAEILEQVGQITCSRGTVWEQTKQWGEQFQAVEAKAQNLAGVVDMKNGVVPGEMQGNKRMGVSMDGGMINIRTEGWKETKIGCVFEVETGLERDEQTGEEVEAGCATHLTYVAHLGEPETFGQKVWAEAKQRGWTRAADTQVVADGAVWIWNLAQDSLPYIECFECLKAKSRLKIEVLFQNIFKPIQSEPKKTLINSLVAVNQASFL